MKFRKFLENCHEQKNVENNKKKSAENLKLN